MNKHDLLRAITENVKKKHPWRISQEKYLKLFGELPKEFLEERIAYDNILEKSKKYKILHLVLSEVKVEIVLTLEQCIIWELNLDKWSDAKLHNIVPNDIKKLLKD
jgi:hypothetical protein